MSDQLYDHISDDGETMLCGVREDQLPVAPLCPVCVAVEKRVPADDRLHVHGVGAVTRPRPVEPDPAVVPPAGGARTALALAVRRAFGRPERAR